jgi:hypothetical protein
MNQLEFNILHNKDILCFTNILLKKYQFNEIFLIKTRKYYNYDVCMRTQKNISLLFCFEYLYDSDFDNLTSKCDINDIIKYFGNKYSKKYLSYYYNHLIKNNYIKH